MSSPNPDFWSGQSFGWRYVAERLTGTGEPGVIIDAELPLRDVTITDVISGPPQFSATISPVYRRLLGPDGLPILDEWSTAIYAEADGQIRSGAIMVDSGFAGPDWNIDGSGFTSYAKGMGYEGDQAFLDVDPLDMIRHMWDHIQGGQMSNLGLILDRGTHTDARIGTPEKTTEFTTGAGEDVSFQSGPYRLAAWLTDDMGEEIDTLAKDHGIEYHERHEWNSDKTSVKHFLDFGVPRLGVRRDLRFVLGENIQTKPEATRSGANFANHVRFLGAGEGSATVRSEARIMDGRLRRMVTLDDKDVRSAQQAQQRARDELARRLALTQVGSVLVRNTEETPLGSWGVGDEIRVQADLDWISFDYWFRVLSITISPENPELIAMNIRRSDA